MTSIYRRALGDDFERLHPELQHYFGQPGVSASGVFDEVGSHHRWLAPLWRLLACVGLLLPEHGVAVPFTIDIEPLSESRVATVRRIRFASSQRIMRDETHLVRGRLIDVHARGRLLMHMLPRVLDDGSLRLEAAATSLRIASVVLRMPTVPTTVTQRWNEQAQQHHIDVSVHLPLLGIALGEVFGYRGTFRQR